MGWNYLCIPKLQGLHRWSLRLDKLFYLTLYNGCNYLSMLVFKLNYVSRRGPWCLLVSYVKNNSLGTTDSDEWQQQHLWYLSTLIREVNIIDQLGKCGENPTKSYHPRFIICKWEQSVSITIWISRYLDHQQRINTAKCNPYTCLQPNKLHRLWIIDGYDDTGCSRIGKNLSVTIYIGLVLYGISVRD